MKKSTAVVVSVIVLFIGFALGGYIRGRRDKEIVGKCVNNGGVAEVSRGDIVCRMPNHAD